MLDVSRDDEQNRAGVGGDEGRVEEEGRGRGEGRMLVQHGLSATSEGRPAQISASTCVSRGMTLLGCPVQVLSSVLPEVAANRRKVMRTNER